MPDYTYEIWGGKKIYARSHSLEIITERLQELWNTPVGSRQEAFTIKRVEKQHPHMPGHSLEKNSLAKRFPKVAKLWHPTKNDCLTPSDVFPYSKTKVWWQCKKGHEYFMAIDSMVSGAKCPCCTLRQAVPGETDLATTHPDVAKLWHPTKNGDLTPLLVTERSAEKVWWQCEKGHEWEERINVRVSRKSSCPYCSGTRLIKGENDIETLYPEIAKEWKDTRLNGGLKPSECTERTFKNVWWQCSKCGTTYQASVFRRVKGWQKCPTCYPNEDNIISPKRAYDGYTTIRRKSNK